MRRVALILAALVIVAAGDPPAAGELEAPDCRGVPKAVCATHGELAQAGDAAGSGTVPSLPSATAPVEELQVCTAAGCRKAAGGRAPADLLRDIYGLLKANENTPIAPCESDRPGRKCKESGFNLFIMAGPLPAYAKLETVTYKLLRLAADNSRIAMRLGITGKFFGASASCQDFDAELALTTGNKPVLKGTDSFYCNWLGIGNIFWNYTHTFDYIDFANGVLAGQFEFSAVGLLTVGGANGYGQYNLNPTQPPAVVAGRERLAAPPAAPPAVPAPIETIDQQLAALKSLHDKGLIDDAIFQSRRDAILQRAFGAAPAAPAGTVENPAPPRPPAVDNIQFGNYHALVIGNNAYQYLPQLRTAIDDARTIAGVLEQLYGFQVTLLLNATRADIVEALDRMTEKLGSNDNLVIYYAGHGWLDQDAGRGYWLATDAMPNRRTNWVSNATLTDTLKTLRAKHVMVIADSCYSGTLTREAKVGVRTGDYWRRMAEKWTRVALVSGGLEPVSDGTGPHSPFAGALVTALRSNTAIIDGTQLFNEIRSPVMTAANQTPQYSNVREAGHDGGDFLFVRRK